MDLRRITNELRQQRIVINDTDVHKALRRKSLNHRLDQLFYVREKFHNPVVSKRYLREFKKWKRMYISAYYPGYLFCQDSYYVDNIKDLRRIYKQTGIDAYSNFGFCQGLYR